MKIIASIFQKIKTVAITRQKLKEAQFRNIYIGPASQGLINISPSMPKN